MVLTISDTKHDDTISAISWIIASASKCSISEPELFKILVLNVVLSNPVDGYTQHRSEKPTYS
jgi:hypothetical protein